MTYEQLKKKLESKEAWVRNDATQRFSIGFYWFSKHHGDNVEYAMYEYNLMDEDEAYFYYHKGKKYIQRLDRMRFISNKVKL